MRKKNFIVWLVLSLFYAFQYIIRTIPAVSINEIIEKFSLDTSQFGLFCGIYYIGYTGMSIPLSIMMDKFDARKVIVCTILMTSTGILPLLSNQWYLVMFGRVMSGMGSAGAILGLFKVIAIYFKPEQSSKMLGMAVTIGLIGGIYGGQPLAMMMSDIGFKGTISSLVIAGIFMALVTFLLLPKDFARQEGELEVSLKSILNDVGSILTNKSLIVLAIAGGLMVGPMEGFTDGWSIITLQTIHGWEKPYASLAPSMIFLGMCFGASVIGYLSEKTQRYYSIISSSSIIMILCFLWILYGDGSHSKAMLAVLITIGIASAYQITVMSKAGLLAGQKLVATGSAMANMIVMVFGIVYHYIIGQVIMQTNSSEGNVYSIEAIKFGVLPIIIGLALSLPLIVILSKWERKS